MRRFVINRSDILMSHLSCLLLVDWSFSIVNSQNFFTKYCN